MSRSGTLGFGVPDGGAVAACEIGDVPVGLTVMVGVVWVATDGTTGPAHDASATPAIARTVAARVRMRGGLIA